MTRESSLRAWGPQGFSSSSRRKGGPQAKRQRPPTGGATDRRECRGSVDLGANLIALEVLVVCDDDARNAVQEDSASAHGAGRKGRVQRRPLVVGSRQAASVLQARHLGCGGGARRQKAAQQQARRIARGCLVYQDSGHGRAAVGSWRTVQDRASVLHAAVAAPARRALPRVRGKGEEEKCVAGGRLRGTALPPSGTRQCWVIYSEAATATAEVGKFSPGWENAGHDDSLSDDFAVNHEDCADRQAALEEAAAGLLDSLL